MFANKSSEEKICIFLDSMLYALSYKATKGKWYESVLIQKYRI